MTALAQLHAKAVLWSRLLYLVGVAALVACGYTIGGTVTGIPMSVTVEALCRYVGYLNDAGAGSCNDLGDAIANRMLSRDLLAGGTTESRTWYAWGIKDGVPQVARAVKAFTHTPGNLRPS